VEVIKDVVSGHEKLIERLLKAIDDLAQAGLGLERATANSRSKREASALRLDVCGH
jgi:hypothetical protein